MRIRKNASKLLLGSASSLYSNPCPSPPPITAAAADADEGLVKCELNCSPWDVMVINPCCNFFTNPKGEEYGGILGNFIKTEEEEDRGILGNLIKTEEEEPISAITSTAGELTITATTQLCEEKVKKIERKKKHKREEKAAAAEMITTYCKKSDGKGWHCKRHAQLPHTLCSYHLAQIRSYSSNHSKATDASTSAANNGKNHKTKAVAAAAAGGVDSNLYYYYDGFGPWRGKRRGRGRADTVNAKMKKEDKQDSSRESTVDFDDDVVAGDDEYDLDNCFDEDDDDDDDDDGNFSMHQELEEINGKKEGSDQEEKKRVEEVKKKKKRGRKPIKARSLKSLL